MAPVGRRLHGRGVTLVATAVFSHPACTRQRLCGHPGFRTHCPHGETLLFIKQHFFWIKTSGWRGCWFTSNAVIHILSPFPVPGSGLQGLACPGPWLLASHLRLQWCSGQLPHGAGAGPPLHVPKAAFPLLTPGPAPLIFKTRVCVRSPAALASPSGTGTRQAESSLQASVLLSGQGSLYPSRVRPSWHVRRDCVYVSFLPLVLGRRPILSLL